MNQAQLKYDLPIIKEDRANNDQKKKMCLYNLIIRKVIIFLMEIGARLGVIGKGSWHAIFDRLFITITATGRLRKHRECY